MPGSRMARTAQGSPYAAVCTPTAAAPRHRRGVLSVAVLTIGSGRLPALLFLSTPDAHERVRRVVHRPDLTVAARRADHDAGLPVCDDGVEIDSDAAFRAREARALLSHDCPARAVRGRSAVTELPLWAMSSFFPRNGRGPRVTTQFGIPLLRWRDPGLSRGRFPRRRAGTKRAYRGQRES